MDTFWHFMEIVAVIALCLVVAAVILWVIVDRLPESPLKYTLTALKYRVAATAVFAVIGLPLQPVPEIDGIYDIGGIILLAFYWYGMIDTIKQAKNPQEISSHLVSSAPKFVQLIRIMKRFKGR